MRSPVFQRSMPPYHSIRHRGDSGAASATGRPPHYADAARGAHCSAQCGTLAPGNRIGLSPCCASRLASLNQTMEMHRVHEQRVSDGAGPLHLHAAFGDMQVLLGSLLLCLGIAW